MRWGQLAQWGVIAVLGATVLALYAPDRADGVIPGSGHAARSLRAYIPEGLGTMIGLPPARTAAASAGSQNRPPVAVRTAAAEAKAVALRVEAIGTAQAAASVAVRSRVDSQIEEVLIRDGALVKQGDILFKLDSRQIEAQIKQAEAGVARSRTVVEQTARDVARIAELASRQVGTQVNLDNARTAAAAAEAAVRTDEAALENLRVQLSYYTIRAPLTGRVGTVVLKAGNIARQGEANAPLVTINQTSPIYVAFSMPQTQLADLRDAMAKGTAVAQATPQGSGRSIEGRVAVIDNAIDAATGTIMVRALFDNPDEFLWPGQLCNVRVTLRMEPGSVTVPAVAVQSGQQGSFVYTVQDNVARVRPVRLSRIQDGEAIIAEGLQNGDTVVVDGQAMLADNARVDVRQDGPRAAGNSAAQPGATRDQNPT